jgi:hypothetical protein
MQPEDNRPPTADDIDREQLRKIKHDSTRILAFTGLVLGILLVFSLIAGSLIVVTQYNALKTQEQGTQEIADTITHESHSLCDFFYVIGTVPVVTSGPHTSSPILVRWIVDSRNTYIARNCVPKLPPISSELRTLVTRDHLELNGLRER